MVRPGLRKYLPALLLALASFQQPPFATAEGNENASVVVFYTMTNLPEHALAAESGGPRGEIVMHDAITGWLLQRGADIHAPKSDQEFDDILEWLDDNSTATVVTDMWTYRTAQNHVKPPLMPHLENLWIIDFFGTSRILPVPLERVLTAYPAEAPRTFVGWAQEPPNYDAPPPVSKRRGVVWGKKKEYFHRSWPIILALADESPVEMFINETDAPGAVAAHPNITFHGAVPPDEWSDILQGAAYLAGMGNPLAGPSALDALAAGLKLIIPIYGHDALPAYWNQHPFAAEAAARENMLCLVEQRTPEKYAECARDALDSQDRHPVVPAEFSPAGFSQRMKALGWVR